MTHHSRPYGVGLAYRNCLHPQIMPCADRIDLLEIPTVDYIYRRRTLQSDPGEGRLREALERFPCVAHGINMSIGSVEPLDAHYFQATRRFLDEHNLPVFSEHLAFHRMDGCDVSMFLSMPFDEASLDWLSVSCTAARRALGRPLALENVSYYFPVPGCPLDEAEFLTRLTERTGCTLLLDVTNIYNNAVNHGYDAVEFLHRLPGDRVTQLHLAGGHYSDGMLQDSHCAPVMEPVWELFDEALRHTAAEIVILERDSDFFPFNGVMRDVDRARSIFHRHRPERPPTDLPAHAASPPAEEAASRSGPDAPEFTDLKNFQRAMVRQIADPDFHRRFLDDPASTRGEYSMSPTWVERLRGSNADRIRLLAKKHARNQENARRDEDRYRQSEWQAWASQLGEA